MSTFARSIAGYLTNFVITTIKNEENNFVLHTACPDFLLQNDGSGRSVQCARLWSQGRRNDTRPRSYQQSDIGCDG